MSLKNFSVASVGIGFLLMGTLTVSAYAQSTEIRAFSSMDSTRLFPSQSKIVADPQEGLLSKLAMIRQAKYTIDIATYIFSDDHSGSMIIRELSKAVARGVSVRMVVDSSGSMSADRDVLAHLRATKPGINPITGKQATVEVKMFHSLGKLAVKTANMAIQSVKDRVTHLLEGTRYAPLFLLELYEQMKAINRRSHDKILLVDAGYNLDAIAIVGGRNLADHYYGIPRVDSETYSDMEVIVRNDRSFMGPSLNFLGNELQSHFMEVFNDKSNRSVAPLTDAKKAAEIQSKLILSTAVMSEDQALWTKYRYYFSEDLLQKGFSIGMASVVSERANIERELIDPDKKSSIDAAKSAGEYSIIESFRVVTQRAQKSIVIVSPYIYLAPDEIKRLQAWLDQDPTRTLTIVSNGLTTTDNDLAQSMVDTMVAPLFMVNPEWSNKNKQVKFYGYGRLDDVSLGGTHFYGKLHAKYGIIDGEWVLVTTSNGDPRSRYLNSEVGFLIRDENLAENLKTSADKLIGESTLWGSVEWAAVREHPKNHMKRIRQKAANLVSRRLLLMI